MQRLKKLRISVLGSILILSMLPACVTSIPNIDITAGDFSPITPTPHDWEVISDHLDGQILDHNANFEVE